MADVPAQLDYAQPLAWRQRKGFRRAVIAVGLLLIAFGSLKFLPAAWNQARLLHYQRRCLTHVDSPGTLAFDGGSGIRKPNADWERFYALFSPPGGIHGPTVFVHELRRPDGGKRLVVVEAELPASSMPNQVLPLFAPPLRFDSTVIVRGGLWEQPQLRSNGSWFTPYGFLDRPGFHLHAGQIDPANPSHFTIAFDYPDHSGTIDGWLQPNDSILFERRGPLSREARSSR
jgi:hypothetical protein